MATIVSPLPPIISLGRPGKWPRGNIDCFLALEIGPRSDFLCAGYFPTLRVLSPSRSTRLLPKLAGDPDRIDAGSLPPRPFITGAVGGAMMDAAQRNRELIAGFAAQCAWLHVAQYPDLVPEDRQAEMKAILDNERKARQQQTERKERR